MKRTILVIAAIALLMPLQAKRKQAIQQTDREYWTALLTSSMIHPRSLKPQV